MVTPTDDQEVLLEYQMKQTNKRSLRSKNNTNEQK